MASQASYYPSKFNIANTSKAITYQSEKVLYISFHLGPDMFNWVQVWWVRKPVDCFNTTSTQFLPSDIRWMAQCAVVLKPGSLRLGQLVLSKTLYFRQDEHVLHGRVRCLILVFLEIAKIFSPIVYDPMKHPSGKPTILESGTFRTKSVERYVLLIVLYKNRDYFPAVGPSIDPHLIRKYLLEQSLYCPINYTQRKL